MVLTPAVLVVVLGVLVGYLLFAPDFLSTLSPASVAAIPPHSSASSPSSIPSLASAPTTVPLVIPHQNTDRVMRYAVNYMDPVLIRWIALLERATLPKEFPPTDLESFRILPSKIHGRGVFLEKTFKKGDIAMLMFVSVYIEGPMFMGGNHTLGPIVLSEFCNTIPNGEEIARMSSSKMHPCYPRLVNHNCKDPDPPFELVAVKIAVPLAMAGMKIPTSNITGHFMRARRDAVIGEEVTFNYMASLYTVPLLAREPIVVKGCTTTGPAATADETTFFLNEANRIENWSGANDELLHDFVGWKISQDRGLTLTDDDQDNFMMLL